MQCQIVPTCMEVFGTPKENAEASKRCLPHPTTTWPTALCLGLSFPAFHPVVSLRRQPYHPPSNGSMEFTWKPQPGSSNQAHKSAQPGDILCSGRSAPSLAMQHLVSCCFIRWEDSDVQELGKAWKTLPPVPLEPTKSLVAKKAFSALRATMLLDIHASTPHPERQRPRNPSTNTFQRLCGSLQKKTLQNYQELGLFSFPIES